MRVMVIPIVVGVFGTVPKTLEKILEISRRFETIHRLEYSEESLKFDETCCLSDSSERSLDKRQMIIVIIILIIDKTQQNSRCSLCGDREETIHHIISECSKLAQKAYKARHDWVGNVIHWEL